MLKKNYNASKNQLYKIDLMLEDACRAIQAGKQNQVKDIYNQLAINFPNNPTFANIFAQTALQNNLIEEGIFWLRKSLEINSDQPSILLNLGAALSEINQFNDALKYFNESIKIDADNPIVYFNQGLMHRNLNQLDNALHSYKKALELNSNYADALNGIGRIYHIKKEYDRAIKYYDKAIQSQSNYSEVIYNKAITLQELKRYEEALACYDRAIQLKPDYHESYNGKGNTLQELKRYEEALACYDRAIQLKPDESNGYWNKSLLKLLMGDYKEGWRLYEWRRQTKETKNNYKVYDQPIWLGKESLQNQILLVESEQGFGDIIQFCRYIPMLEKLGAKVILEIPKTLTSLIKTLHGNFLVIEKGQTLPSFDYHIPILSLPLAFQTMINNIPASIPYLYSDKTKTDYWNKRLNKKTKLRVGLVWSGSIIHKNDKNRSLLLKDLEPILQLPFEFHSLQKEIRENDLSTLNKFNKIYQHQDELNDFSDTAGLIEEMDLIISVDTSVAHLAGALGKDVWILLPYHPDYRWMLDRYDSPWYPTCTLFRQSKIDDWSDPILEIIFRLQNMFKLSLKIH